MVNFGYIKIILEKGKTTLLPFSPYSRELHAGKSEFARRILFQNNSLKKEKSHFFLFSLMSIRMRVKSRGVL